MTVYKINELSKETGTSIETIRYYENIMLIPKPKRSDKNYRLYDISYVTLLEFITQTKKLGFSLKEIQSLLRLGINKNENCSEIKVQIDKKIERIEQKVKQLGIIKKRLKDFSKQCTNSKDMGSNCAFLDTFNI